MALNSNDRSGCEWLIEARGCCAATLCNEGLLQALFEQLIEALHLHQIGTATWHRFQGTGGITGLALLQESHLACHTFPEFGALCLNVFCCRPRPDWDFAAYLKQEFQAREVNVRRVERPY